MLLATGSADHAVIVWRVQLFEMDAPWLLEARLLVRHQVPLMHATPLCRQFQSRCIYVSFFPGRSTNKACRPWHSGSSVYYIFLLISCTF